MSHSDRFSFLYLCVFLKGLFCGSSIFLIACLHRNFLPLLMVGHSVCVYDCSIDGIYLDDAKSFNIRAYFALYSLYGLFFLTDGEFRVHSFFSRAMHQHVRKNMLFYATASNGIFCVKRNYLIKFHII